MNTLLLRYFLIACIHILSFRSVFSSNEVFCRNYFSYLQKIGNHTFRLWIADTDEKRLTGLMGVLPSQLKSREGMIFVVRQSKPLSFWMKNTPLPLDIAFLDKNGKVIKIESMVPFSRKSVASNEPALYAIESKAGSLKKILKVGQYLSLPHHLKQNCK